MQGEAPKKDDFGFHLEEKPDPPFEWSEFGLEDWPAFLVFWGLTVIVFLQFFTRYVLNDSFGWTEEAARYFLIGTTFVGGSASVAFGDYRTGANHVLPTQGLARAFSGLSAQHFLRSYTVQEVTAEGAAAMADDVALLAEAEGLPAHAAAARARSRS